MDNINIGRLTITHDFERDAECFFLDSRSTAFHLQYGLRIMWIHKHGGDEYSNFQSRKWLKPRYFSNYYNVSHLIDGHGWLYMEKRGKTDLRSGDGIIMFPGILHDYNGYDRYCEDCLAFSGPLADHLAACGIIRPGVLHIGRIRRLLPIIELAADPGAESQIKANLQLQNLLTELYFENQDDGRKVRHSSFADLLKVVSEHPDKWWTVADLAELAGMSVNHFIREFRSYSGSTPKSYIDTMKINMAAEELRNTEAGVETIARRYGYRDVYHFSRRFKKIVGVSPAHYRKSFVLAGK